MVRRIIWQYWETRDTKPKYIDGLREIAQRNSGVELVLVTPETLRSYLPDVPDAVFKIEELAHKADMIRTMLLREHGGMWLDSCALVLRDLNWLFDLLERYEFVAFNNGAKLRPKRPWVRVGCVLSRPHGRVVSEWVSRQHEKFPKTAFQWEEIGTDLLHPICLKHRRIVKILPLDLILPVTHRNLARYMQPDLDADRILKRCSMVMLCTKAMEQRVPALKQLAVEEIAAGDYPLAKLVRSAMSPTPPTPRSSWLSRFLPVRFLRSKIPAR